MSPHSLKFGAGFTLALLACAAGCIADPASPAHFENYFEELALVIEKHHGQRPDPTVIAQLYSKYDSELIT